MYNSYIKIIWCCYFVCEQKIKLCVVFLVRKLARRYASGALGSSDFEKKWGKIREYRGNNFHIFIYTVKYLYIIKGMYNTCLCLRETTKILFDLENKSKEINDCTFNPIILQ